MKQKKIYIGVVGGHFGSLIHVPAFQSEPRCEVIGVAASSYERSQELLIKHNLIKAYHGWEELVNDDQIDAISIAVPPFLQPTIALAALEKGKAVFAEKPLAANLEQAKILYDVAVASQLPHMVNFHLSTLEAWIKAKQILKEGGIGDLRHIVVQYMSSTPLAMLNSWKGLKGPGRGMLFDYLSHFFHALEWFHEPIVALNAKLFSTFKNATNLDTFDVLALEFSSGAAASIIASKAAVLGSGYKIEFSGEEGTLILENKSKDIQGFCLFHGTRTSNKLELIYPSTISEDPKPVDGRISTVGKLTYRFLDWIEKGKSETPNFAQGFNVQRLLEAARISDENAQWIKPFSPLI